MPPVLFVALLSVCIAASQSDAIPSAASAVCSSAALMIPLRSLSKKSKARCTRSAALPAGGARSSCSVRNVCARLVVRSCPNLLSSLRPAARAAAPRASSALSSCGVFTW
eukprot:scaffold21885_cov53-Phaeocystis_antarctica.AAC.1